MAICVTLSGSDVVVDSLSTYPDCAGYALLSSTEFAELETISGLTNTLETLFAFSSADFAMINGWLFLGFVVGNGTGRLVRTLGKV